MVSQARKMQHGHGWRLNVVKDEQGFGYYICSESPSFLACFKGRLSTALGVIFIVIYVLFVLVALAFEYDYVQCPV